MASRGDRPIQRSLVRLDGTVVALAFALTGRTKNEATMNCIAS